MTQSIEFYFDVGSPATYLAYTQLPALAQTGNAELIYKPMLLGGVFKATGNASPITVPAKGRWMADDLQHWADKYAVPFQFNPHFPINTLALMRGATGIQMRQPQDLKRYLDAIFSAMWVKPRDLNDPAVVAALLTEHEFDAGQFMALIADPLVKQQLIANTEEAVNRGVFGAPSCFVGEKLFFGQDRLDFIAAALSQ
ncbi:MAG: 2-hydroxychromene-2-carboxylate isomerase [Burkholderiaceae bacterium]